LDKAIDIEAYDFCKVEQPSILPKLEPTSNIEKQRIRNAFRKNILAIEQAPLSENINSV
jgi:hypothetical protein